MNLVKFSPAPHVPSIDATDIAAYQGDLVAPFQRTRLPGTAMAILPDGTALSLTQLATHSVLGIQRPAGTAVPAITLPDDWQPAGTLYGYSAAYIGPVSPTTDQQRLALAGILYALANQPNGQAPQ